MKTIYYNKKNYLYQLKNKCRLIILFNIILLIFFLNSLSITISSPKYIFTFWEPHNKVPGYLLLCLETWKKFFPNYKIILLDYSNLSHYLGSSFVYKILNKNMALPIQADAIRVALLQKYGGIWMDLDIIITNRKFLSMVISNLVMLGNQEKKNQNIGFIYASKKSNIIKIWLKYIIKRISYFRLISFIKNYYQNNYIKNEWEKVHKWNYLGNGIVDKYLINVSKKEFARIDRNNIGAFPEYNFIKNESSSINKYKKFYFSNGNAEDALKFSKGIICLHNSWTPIKYKNISKEKFLNLDILISKLFRLLIKSL